MRPEHLCALWLQAGGAKRRELVEVLRQSGAVDEGFIGAARQAWHRRTTMNGERQRPRPAESLVEAQREAKARWREMAGRSLPEKLRMLLEMQRRLYPILSRRRPMRPWERPWDIDA
jgi:hypothetical protein